MILTKPKKPDAKYMKFTATSKPVNKKKVKTDFKNLVRPAE